MIMVTIKGTPEFTEKWKETWAFCLFLVFLASLYFSAWCVYALLLATYSSFPLGPWRPTNLRQSGRDHADACGGIEDGAFLSWNSKLTHCSHWRWITAGFPPSCHTDMALEATSEWPGTVLFRVVSMGQMRTIQASHSLWSRLQGWVTVCLVDIGLNHFRLGALQLNSSDTHFCYFLPSHPHSLQSKTNSCLYFFFFFHPCQPFALPLN